MKLLRFFVKLFDMFYPDSTGLMKSGHWRVKYHDTFPDGTPQISKKMTHDAACDYAEIFGGEVHYVRYNDIIE